jgi:hypothetical protein
MVAPGQPGAFDGACIAQSNSLTPEQIAAAPRIAREVCEIYIEARRDRH